MELGKGDKGEQGIQGKQGVRGFEGPQGIQGPSSRSHKQQTKHDRNVTLSFTAVVIICTLIVTFFGIQLKSTHDLSIENKQRIIDNAQTRRDLLKVSERSDYKLCKEIKKLNGGFRKSATMNYKNLDRNLKLLNITKTDEITVVALQQLDAQLFKYKDINCKELRR